jgi:hypothetical protein
MKLKLFEEALHKAPFAPFDVHVDGKVIHVAHTDRVLFTPDRTTVVIAPDDNRIHILEVDRIQFVSLHRRRKAAK